MNEDDLFAVRVIEAEELAQVLPVGALTLVRGQLQQLNGDLHFDVIAHVPVVAVRHARADVDPALDEVTGVVGDGSLRTSPAQLAFGTHGAVSDARY